MKVPDWRQLTLDEGILKEPIPDDDRIVFWLPANGESEPLKCSSHSSMPRNRNRFLGFNAASTQELSPAFPLAPVLRGEGRGEGIRDLARKTNIL